MSLKLPLPRTVSDAEVMDLFKRHGFDIVSDKKINIDVCEIIASLLKIAQWCQWWGDLLRANEKSIGIKMDTEEFLGFSVHAAEGGQNICAVPTNTVDATLNILRTWVANLRAYGKNPELRSERVHDSGDIRLQNELLDSLGQLLVEVMALGLPVDEPREG